MAKDSSRAAQIGVGIRHIDAAHYSIARMGGVFAHDFCTSLENKSANDLHVAIVDAGCGQVGADNTIKNMTLSLHRLGKGEKAPNMACWKEFNLGAIATVTCAGGDAPATATFTPGAAGQHTVIGVNLSVPCTLGLAQEAGETPGATVVNNTSLPTLFPAGVTHFLVYSTGTGAVTLTFTKIGDTHPAPLVNATSVEAYPVIPWKLGNVNIIY